jgi:hypothetical protein
MCISRSQAGVLPNSQPPTPGRKPLSVISLILPQLPRKVSITAAHDAPASEPVLSAGLGAVSHTAIRQAIQSVMKYIARKTIKLGYSPHSYSKQVQ